MSANNRERALGRLVRPSTLRRAPVPSIRVSAEPQGLNLTQMDIPMRGKGASGGRDHWKLDVVVWNRSFECAT
jgi:hypothetical protein